MPEKDQGFFVKNNDDTYSGPFAALNEARADARFKGPNLEIYHGVLKMMPDGKIDDKELYLVPKCKNDRV